MPGKSGLAPGALALGSMISNTGPARQLSPGQTISNSTFRRQLSFSNIWRSSPVSAYSVVPSNRGGVPNRISVTGWVASVSSIFIQIIRKFGAEDYSSAGRLVMSTQDNRHLIDHLSLFATSLFSPGIIIHSISPTATITPAVITYQYARSTRPGALPA